MTIQKVEFSTPEGLAQEMEALSKLGVGNALSYYSSSEQYYREYMDTAGGLELKQRISAFGKNLQILDIGVGMGFSSFYLSDIGHRVTVVEPSRECCLIIDGLSEKFNSNITVFQCSGEDMNKIDDTDFDLCFFNSSLHHCYDPNAAIENGYHLLKPGGQLLVINEIFLKFYQTKNQFYQKMKSDPVSMGNYGGNEHAYYYKEYKKMLTEAGFKDINEYIPFSYIDPRSIIKHKMSLTIDGQYIFSDVSLLLRYVWYILASRLVRINLTRELLKRLSTILISFEATKKPRSG